MYEQMWKSLKEIFEIEKESINRSIGNHDKLIFTDKYIHKITNISKLKTIKNILKIMDMIEKENLKDE